MSTILDIIKKRRSIRKYKPEQITDEQLKMILEAARFAPSGSNNQSSHFVAVQSAVILDELRTIVRGEFAKMDENGEVYGSIKTSIKLSKKGTYNFMYNPPTLIIAANRRGYGNAMADCSLALGNMMLTATDLGLGTCWINQLKWLNSNQRVIEYLKKLGISDEEIVCGSLAVGYPDQSDLPPIVRMGNRTDIIK